MSITLQLGSAIAGPLEDAVAAHEREDYLTAARMLLPLAEQGDPIAEALLGTMYDQGQGVPVDVRQATKWIRRSAEHGHASAEMALGVMYTLGRGVPLDNVQAAKWLRKAADQGAAPAQNYLGLLYEGGQGVPQDYVLAYMWFNLASAQSTYTAASDDARKSRDELRAKMTRAQVAEAQKLARNWKPAK